MFDRSTTNHMQTNQDQELVPLTPEVAREIEKLLIKNADVLENVRARHTASRSAEEIQRQTRAAQISNS